MFKHRAMTFVLAAALTALLGATVVAQMDTSDEDRAAQLLEEITSAPYTDWAFQPGIPETYYVGQEPHGMILRVFANDVAIADYEAGEGAHSEGAILVKENHSAEGVDISGMDTQTPVEDFEDNLVDLTYMVKIDGYNPDAGDWFWGKMQTDGTIAAVGTPNGCIACHGQVADNDYIFNADLGEGM